MPSVPLYQGPKIIGAMPTWAVPMSAFLRFIGFCPSVPAEAESWVTFHDTIRGNNEVVTLLQTKYDGRLFIKAQLAELGILDCVQNHNRIGIYKYPAKGTYVENKYRIYHNQIFAF